MQDRGCYFLKPDETEKVRKTIIINGAFNAKIVGQKPLIPLPLWPALTVPESTKILIGEVQSVLSFPKNLLTKNSPRFWPCIRQRTLPTRWIRQSS